MRGVCINEYNQERHITVGKIYELKEQGVTRYNILSDSTKTMRAVYKRRFRVLPNQLNNKTKVI